MKPALRIIDLVTSDKDKKYEPAGRMAEVIVDITERNGGCLPQDLNEKGFTPAEVVEHWPMAKAIADIELKLMAEKPAKTKLLNRKK